ncbi:hypothetical protein C8J56DRAFT_963731 [Mycena floridula]|nr:hypothetical protein C8J56DRAFT_963731 [Mycena floridula]
MSVDPCSICGSCRGLSTEAMIQAGRSDNQRFHDEFLDLFRSNHPPSKEISAKANRYIEMAEERIKCLNEQEQRLEDLFDVLQEERNIPEHKLDLLVQEEKRLDDLLDLMHEEKQVLRRSIYTRKALLTPARQLPYDIIKILLLAMPEGSWNPLKTQAFPWVASRISKIWRDASTATPQLWSSLIIRFDYPNYTVGHDELLERCLAYSAAQPLIFSISFPKEVLSTTDLISRSSKALTLLVSHCERWESATFVGVPKSLEAIFPQISGRVDKLKQIAWVNGFEVHETFSVAPRLQSATISFPVVQCLPWLQITDLTLHLRNQQFSDPQAPSDVHRILSSCQQLEMLFIYSRYTTRFTPVRYDEALVTLPHLRDLYCPEPLLGTLTTPALKTLTMSCNSCQFDLPQFIFRSKCELTKLVLFGDLRAIEPQTVIDAFSMSPTVTKLLFHCYAGTATKIPSIVRALFPQKEGYMVLPKLQYLDLDMGTDDQDASTTRSERWLEMIKARLPAPIPIKVRLRNYKMRPLAELSRFRDAIYELRAMDVDVELDDDADKKAEL